MVTKQPAPPHSRVIHAPPDAVAPNMPDYARARAEFSWARAHARLAGLPGGGLNIAYEAVDRQADGPLAGAVALRFLSKRRPVTEFTYATLKHSSGSAPCARRGQLSRGRTAGRRGVARTGTAGRKRTGCSESSR